MSYDENGREILLTGKPTGGYDGRKLNTDESPRDHALYKVSGGGLLTKQAYTQREAAQQTSATVGACKLVELAWNNWNGWYKP